MPPTKAKRLTLAFILGASLVGAAALPARADDNGWRNRQWREREWRHHDWRDRERDRWAWRHRYDRPYYAPGYSYYRPPVVVEPQPYLNLGFTFR